MCKSNIATRSMKLMMAKTLCCANVAYGGFWVWSRGQRGYVQPWQLLWWRTMFVPPQCKHPQFNPLERIGHFKNMCLRHPSRSSTLLSGCRVTLFTWWCIIMYFDVCMNCMNDQVIVVGGWACSLNLWGSMWRPIWNRFCVILVFITWVITFRSPGHYKGLKYKYIEIWSTQLFFQIASQIRYCIL